MFKKTLFAMVTTALFSGAAFNASAEDQGHGTVTFTGTVITAPCSVAPESSKIEVWLGQVADTVLNGDSDATPTPFSIHLVDCTLSVTDGEGATTVTDKVKVTFTSANVDTTDTSLMANTKENSYGGAKGVGVRILDAGYKTVTLGQPFNFAFADLNNPTQNLDFNARMESKGHNATEGDVYAQANYVLSYK
ncbi:TPA: fimbrial-like protein [Kluyvera ascorbata]|uniref:Fimbrial protein n=1 Tax=Kluyvera genomosp. 2 TaxID=2774054 RepID=A0A2T2Y0L6_9ENTR|nr:MULTISPECIES: fimbrial-like protein [Enterobacteriaceae]HAT3919007.1 fimbrial-like protein [Kluyvera ascorbata]PSR46094.1 fimbrial protein [Kluyvera genomosp. 2]BBQ83523.1 fimbrial protein [Klebsiella sp. WP3-W18-ESBL-02]BBR20546.1 fimbrial protein [Klebsiella sp. WP3-S18-ESBL-05]HAT3943920.1 fimbrial-like protein [Kluyvera ascorbata]